MTRPTDRPEAERPDGDRPVEDETRRRLLAGLGFAGAGFASPTQMGYNTTNFSLSTSSTSSTMNSYYDVTESPYGAAGDGSNDDTQAIQDAIDDVGAAGGGVVYFPQGNYRVTAMLTIADVDDVILKGIGHGSVLFTDSDSVTPIRIDSTSGGKTNTRYNKVLDLTIDRSVAPTSTVAGITVEEARYTTIEGVTLHNHGRGISVGVPSASGIPCQWVTITDCQLTETGSKFGEHGFPDAGIKLFQVADVKMHNTAIEPTNVGISLVDGSNGVLMNQMGIINARDFTTGIDAAGDGFCRYVTNTIIENATSEQIRVGGSSSRFYLTSSWLGAGDTDSYRRGVDIKEGATRIMIHGNRISDQTAEAIYSNGAHDVKISDNRMFDNHQTDNGDTSTIIIDGGTSVSITNNRIWSLYTTYSVALNGSLDKYMVTNNDFTVAEYVDPNDTSGEGIYDAASGTNNVVSQNLLP